MFMYRFFLIVWRYCIVVTMYWQNMVNISWHMYRFKKALLSFTKHLIHFMHYILCKWQLLMSWKRKMQYICLVIKLKRSTSIRNLSGHRFKANYEYIIKCMIISALNLLYQSSSVLSPLSWYFWSTKDIATFLKI